MDIVRLGFTVGSLCGLDCAVGDVSTAFLHGITGEKVYIVAGSKFGELAGKRLIVYKGLYGLTTSAARYHEVMAAKLRAMGFRPSKVDRELWLRETKDGLEYLALYVDDVCVWSKDPNAVLKRRS